MKTLNVAFYFPYNWYQRSSVKVRNINNDWLGKIKFAEETKLEISNVEGEKLIFSTALYESELNLDQIEGAYALLYFDIKNYLGLLNPKILQVKTFTSARDRSRFRNSLYPKFGRSKHLEDKNYSIIFFGLTLSFFVMISSVLFFDDEAEPLKDAQMNFIIGLTNFISLGFLLRQAYTTVRGYKHTVSTVLVFFLISLFYVEYTFLLVFIGFLTAIFTIKTILEFRRLNKS